MKSVRLHCQYNNTAESSVLKYFDNENRSGIRHKGRD